MKKACKRLINGVLSLITTFLVMASPVAAIIYASEPIGVGQRYDVGSLVLDTPRIAFEEPTPDTNKIAFKEQFEQMLPDLIEAQSIQESTLKLDQREIMSKIKQ
jgi:hypothetical protein